MAMHWYHGHALDTKEKQEFNATCQFQLKPGCWYDFRQVIEAVPSDRRMENLNPDLAWVPVRFRYGYYIGWRTHYHDHMFSVICFSDPEGKSRQNVPLVFCLPDELPRRTSHLNAAIRQFLRSLI